MYPRRWYNRKKLNDQDSTIGLQIIGSIDEDGYLRREIAKVYKDVFSNFSEFTPQDEPAGYKNSYFSFCVKTPFQKLNKWKSFYNYHLKNGGDSFYAMMSIVYQEDIMKKLGYAKKYKGKCEIAEQIQPNCMLFKTNYRSVKEAKKNIDILFKNLKRKL